MNRRKLLQAHSAIDSNKFTKLIIKLVREKPIIWNGDPRIKRKERDEAWEIISKEIGQGQTVLKCKKRWKMLRDNFVRNHKVSDMKWRYYKDMLFLKEIYKNKSNLKLDDTTNDLVNQTNEFSNEEDQSEGSQYEEIKVDEESNDINLNDEEIEIQYLEPSENDNDSNIQISEMETDRLMEEIKRGDEYGIKYGEIFLLNNIFVYCCYFCDEKFVTGETFQEHCNMEHSIEENVTKPEFTDDIPNEENVLDKNEKETNESGDISTNNLINEIKTEDDTDCSTYNIFDQTLEIEKLELFECNVCNYQTKNKLTFKQHCDKHPEEFAFKSDLCDKEFTKVFYMTEHRKMHKLKDGPNCNFCGKLFVFPSNLKAHIMQVHGNTNTSITSDKKMSDEYDSSVTVLAIENIEQSIKSEEESENQFEMTTSLSNLNKKAILPHTNLQCGLCKFKTNERNQYIKHCDINHSNESCYKCDICPILFKKWKYLSQHRNIHTLRNGSNCKYCGKTFIMPDRLRIHEFLHTNKEKPTGLGRMFYQELKCGCCDYKTKLIKDFQKHCENHIKNGLIPFKCSTCNKTFNQYRYLTYHMNLHRREFDGSCLYCKKKFNTIRRLREHEKMHTSTRKIHRCQYCNKEFNLACTLRAHENIHTGNRPHKCDFCPLAFYSRSTKQSHMRVKHLDDKRFSCQTCKKTYLTQTQSTICEASHEGRKLYVCEVCGNSYIRNSYLLKHLKSHANLRSYECELCSKKFNTNNNLNHHMIVHTGERKWKCQLCSKTFARNNNLKQHTKTHFKD